MNLLIHWVVNAVALLVVAALFKNVKLKGLGSALAAALVIGLLNVFLGTVLQFLALPITFLTLGLFALVINAFLFWLAGNLLSGFEVEGAFSAFFGSIVYSILTTAIANLVFPVA
jgi:putative membrane protein